MNLLSSVRSCGTRDWKGTGGEAGLSVLLLFPLFESGSRVSGYSRSRKSSSNRSPRQCIISARMARIIKVNSPWKNTCQYASCTFFSLYSRKAKFLRLARERCRWTELYLKGETRENIRGSRLDLSRSVRGSCSFRFCRGLYTRDYFYSTLGTEIYRNERNSFV